MAYDLGDVATLSVNVKDSTGAPANAGAMVCTVTAPDGTTSTPSITNTPVGTYTVSYTTTLVGRHGVRWVATGANAGAYTDVFDVADPAALPIVSLSDLKAHIGASTATTDDEELRVTLNTATALAENYANRSLRRATYVETYNGADPISPYRGVFTLRLRHSPILSVTSIVENGVTLDAATYTISPDSGLVYRGSTTNRIQWAPGMANIVVTYVAGYANPPWEAQRAVLEISRWLWSSQRGTVALPSLQDDFSQAYSNDALPPWVFRYLDGMRIPAS